MLRLGCGDGGAAGAGGRRASAGPLARLATAAGLARPPIPRRGLLVASRVVGGALAPPERVVGGTARQRARRGPPASRPRRAAVPTVGA
jgi:hypothetical protein